MENSIPASPKPKILVKSRMRHKRIFSVLLVGLLIFSSTKWPENQMVHEIMQWTGYFLILLGVGIRVYSSLYAGGFKNEQVLDKGPYSIVRNPLYVGTFLIIVGIGLQTASLILAAMLVTIFIFYYQYIVACEERYLQEKFGEDYAAYKNAVPRWIPSISLWKSPEEIRIYPRYVLITARDCLFFLFIIPAFEFLHVLQDAGYIRTFFYFY